MALLSSPYNIYGTDRGTGPDYNGILILTPPAFKNACLRKKYPGIWERKETVVARELLKILSTSLISTFPHTYPSSFYPDVWERRPAVRFRKMPYLSYGLMPLKKCSIHINT